MSTVTATDPRDKLTCTEALDRAYHLALEKLPEDTHGRLEKALHLVEAGQVFGLDSGAWEVQSQSQPGLVHHVNGACDCTWSEHHPGNRCTHQYAVLLQRKTMQLMAQTQASEVTAADVRDDETAGDLVDVMPTTRCAGNPAPVASLGEAPASCNVYVMIGGHKVQVTLRDTDERRMLERLQVLLATYPAAPTQPAAPTSAPQTPAASETPVCQWHGAMKASTKAKGTFYCSSRMGDGSYCKERYPKA